MAEGRPEPATTVEAAFRRMAVLKAIVASERRQAEREPYGRRNIELGIVDVDQPRTHVRQRIEQLFNELELLMQHLTLLHIAASFESEAKARLSGVAIAARDVLRSSRASAGDLAARLVKSADDFRGLSDLGRVLGLPADDLQAFRMITKARNDISHGMPLDRVNPIAADEAKAILIAALEAIV